jgi:hypothetical protein
MCKETKRLGINNQNHPHETFHIRRLFPTIAKIIKSQVIEAIN